MDAHAGAGIEGGTVQDQDNATAKPKRSLLPYLPVRTEMALHHPRPRRLDGVMSEDADVESGGATATMSDTEKECMRLLRRVRTRAFPV